MEKTSPCLRQYEEQAKELKEVPKVLLDYLAKKSLSGKRVQDVINHENLALILKDDLELVTRLRSICDGFGNKHFDSHFFIFLVEILIYHKKIGKLQLTEDQFCDFYKDDIKQTVDDVAKYFNLNVQDLKSKKRDGKINHARNVAMYLLKKIFNLSDGHIVDMFNRDHVAVLISRERVIQAIQSDQERREEIESIEAQVIYEK